MLAFKVRITQRAARIVTVKLPGIRKTKRCTDRRTCIKAVIEVVLTRARDYGIVRLLLDGQPLDELIDLYNSPEVVTTGVLSFPKKRLATGKHRFAIEITGTNPSAVKQYMVGLDYVRLVKTED